MDKDDEAAIAALLATRLPDDAPEAEKADFLRGLDLLAELLRALPE